MKLMLIAVALHAAGAMAQPTGAMSQRDLAAVTDGGVTLSLGGPDEGYTGTLRLNADGTGEGEARTDSGTVLPIEGVWSIRDNRFCRRWRALNEGAEVCETWVRTGPRAADVYNGDRRIGVNRW